MENRTSITEQLPSTPEAQIKQAAQAAGFDLVGIAPAVSPTGYFRLEEWLKQGYAGEMHYIENRKEAYSHPQYVFEGVQSVIMLGTIYDSGQKVSPQPGQARISRYAWGTEDYHHVIRRKLKELSGTLHTFFPKEKTRGVIDTAPLLERDFARLAGLGWFGKNTLLINKWKGSFFFLAGLLSTQKLKPDAPHETAHCGTCTRCLEACPTNAFPEPYVLDARKCISYLTIELREKPVPFELREGMQDWAFGCDICQDVCPWNQKSPTTYDPGWQAMPDLAPLDAIQLLQMSAAQFEQRFKKTPMNRPNRRGMLRNAAIVLGNQKAEVAVPLLIERLADEEPLIRGAAVWALGRISTPVARTALQNHVLIEQDPEIQQELRWALDPFPA